MASDPNFSSTKTADQTSYVVGQAITYTIVVTNSGSGAGSASVTDTVPALVSVSKVTCVTSVATDTCAAGPQTNKVAGSVTLSPGASATFTIAGVTNAAGDAQNAEVVTATTMGCTTQCGGGKVSTGSLPVAVPAALAAIDPPDPALAFTGMWLELVAFVGLALLICGLVFLAIRRPSRRPSSAWDANERIQ